MTTKPERNEINGAVICYDPLMKKFEILDCQGETHGYRRTIEDARALAATLPGEPYQEPEPPPINISPRAHALRATLGLDPYEPVADPNDGAASKIMSEARRRSGNGPSDRMPEVAPRPRERT